MSTPRRRWIILVAVVACLAPTTPGFSRQPASDLPPPGKIRDLDYGDVLFHYFQDDYFGALVRLEAARDLHRLPHHDADAELLSGGLYLSLGLHAEARRIFDRLLAGPVPQSVADRARFYLARIGYQRGYYDQAWQSLQDIGGTLPAPLESERRLLAANVLMAQSRFSEAAALLQAAPEDDWAPYARFNLGVALVRAGDAAQGQQWLEAVGTMPAASEELLSLRDRANLALGYARLQQQAAEPAAAALARVRLDGPFTNRALLGLGWAESDASRPDRALVPWLELRERRLLDSAVQESFLAVPYAYTKLASNGQAATQYRFAVKAYADETRRIDESIAAIRSGGFLDSVLEAAPDADAIGWFWQLQEVPDAPQTRYLYHLLATHEFQEGLKNYRDLRVMQRNLAGWRESLAAFDEMVATRVQAAALREPRRVEQLAATDLDGLAAAQATLEQRVAEISASRDVAALATDAESRQWQLLDRVATAIASLPPGPQRDALAERARVLRGTLIWQLDSAYKVRLRSVETGLRDTAALLAEARERVDLVDQAGQAAPEATQGFAERVRELDRRVADIGPRIDAASAAQERLLAGIAVHELEEQKKRLANYAMQAQFALAALYDGAATGGSP
jgi:predicted negative regulator of RcsB-dependent stress response